MKLRWRTGFVCVLAMTASACSWARFDEVAKDAPVEVIDKPDELGQGFGVGLATASLADKVRLFVGGNDVNSPGAIYELGTADTPNLEPIDVGSCDQDPQSNPCFLGFQVAGAARLTGPDGESHDLCFVLGIGSTPNTGDGVLVRCEDNTEYAMPAPPDANDDVIAPAIDLGDFDRLRITADRTPDPAILVGAPRGLHAWYYGPNSLNPVELRPGSLDPELTYGSAVGIALVGSTRVLAVSAPEAEQLWLFRSDDNDSAELLGCIGGTPGFGRAVAAGVVNADANDDLVVADARNVHVFDAARLLELEPPAFGVTECSLGSLPPGALIASFGCGTNIDTADCDNSDFGTSLAVGDLDGDGDGEVLVGAPNMTARTQTGAGAVLVYDVEGERLERANDVKFVASIGKDDRLGASITAPNLGERSIIAAGIPGDGKTALFYCGAVVPKEASARCQ